MEFSNRNNRMGSQISSNNHLNSKPIETRTYLLPSHASIDNQHQTNLTGTAVDTPPPHINSNDEGDNPKTASASVVLEKSDIIDYSRNAKCKTYKEKLESVANDLLNVIGRLNELRETSESCTSFSTIQTQLNCVHTKLVNRAMAENPKKTRQVKTLRYKVVPHECQKVRLKQKCCDPQCSNPIREATVASVESLPPCKQNVVYCNNIREEPACENQINQDPVQCDGIIKTPQISSNNHLNCKPIETRVYLLANHTSMENQHQSKVIGAAVDNPPPPINQNDEGDNPKTASGSIILEKSDTKDCSHNTKCKNYKENLESVTTDLLNVIERLNEVLPTCDCNSFSTIQSQLNGLHTKLVDRKMAGKPQKVRTKNKSSQKNIYTGQLIDCDLRTLRDKVDSREYPKVILSQTFGDQQCNIPIREAIVASVGHVPRVEQNKVYDNNSRKAPAMTVESAAPFENQINQNSVHSDRFTNSSHNAPLYRTNRQPRRISFTGSGHYLTVNHQDRNKAPSPAINNISLQTSGNQKEIINDVDYIFKPHLSSTETSIQQSGYCMINNSVPQDQNQTNGVLTATGPAEYAQHQNQIKHFPVASDPMEHSQHHNPAHKVLIATGRAEYVEHQNRTNNVPIEACPMHQSQRQNQTNKVPTATGSLDQCIIEQLHDSNQTLAIHDLIKEASKTIPFNIAEVENFFNVICGLKGRLGWTNLLLVVVENIRTFTAVKIFNKVTFEEVGHFTLTAPEMRSVYNSGLLELFQYIKNLNTLQNPYALEQFRPSTVQLILQEQDDPRRQALLPTNNSAADLRYDMNCTLEPQSYLDFSGINQRAF